MARPLNRNQQLQNTAFLRALARTGNVRGAARQVGIAYATLQTRRARHRDFATRWDAALASAQARLNGTGTRRPEARASAGAAAHRTAGGEPVIVRLRSGRMQVRAAHPGKLTRACEQAFLLALSATANIRLSAAAAGASEAAFHRRRRQNPGFAREMRLALAEGYERVEEALIGGFLADSHQDDAWRHNEAPDPPPVSARQALQLLYLHQKAVKLPWGREAFRPRKEGAAGAAQQARIAAQYRAETLARAEDLYLGEVRERTARLPSSPHEPRVALPDLAQVTGWSRADPAKPPHGEAALFGGWRVEHLTRAQREAGRKKAAAARERLG